MFFAFDTPQDVEKIDLNVEKGIDRHLGRMFCIYDIANPRTCSVSCGCSPGTA